MKGAVAVLRSAVGVFALSGIVIFTGCGGGGGSSNPKALVGQWVNVDGEFNFGDDMELLSSGSAVFNANMSGKWEIVDKRFVMTASVLGTDVSEAVDYKLSGSELTLVSSKGDTAIYVRKENLEELGKSEKVLYATRVIAVFESAVLAYVAEHEYDGGFIVENLVFPVPEGSGSFTYTFLGADGKTTISSGEKASGYVAGTIKPIGRFHGKLISVYDDKTIQFIHRVEPANMEKVVRVMLPNFLK
jgi:hypothetical protein